MARTCMDPNDFAMLQKLPGNLECIDCGELRPDWGSPKLGILFCFNCSGKHRGLGTHVSFVRSVTMDSWTEQQIQLMKVGGNAQCKEFLSHYGIDLSLGTPFHEKYDTPAAELYRQVLSARVEKRPEPTELPKVVSKTTTTTTPILDKSRLQGFGSSPAPQKQQQPQTPQRRNVPKTVMTAATLAATAGVVAWLILHVVA